MPEHRIDRLSATNALRALYIDFEGKWDRPPVLLGVHRAGRGEHSRVQQDVTDPLFDGLVPPRTSKPGTFADRGADWPNRAIRGREFLTERSRNDEVGSAGERT